MSFGTQNGERLRAERERLGLSQQQLADAAAIQRTMVSRYERGVAEPGASVLMAFAAQGIDIMLVLTGQSSTAVATVTPEERALLDNYKNAGAEGQAAARKILDALAQPAAPGKKVG